MANCLEMASISITNNDGLSAEPWCTQVTLNLKQLGQKYSSNTKILRWTPRQIRSDSWPLDRSKKISGAKFLNRPVPFLMPLRKMTYWTSSCLYLMTPEGKASSVWHQCWLGSRKSVWPVKSLHYQQHGTVNNSNGGASLCRWRYPVEMLVKPSLPWKHGHDSLNVETLQTLHLLDCICVTCSTACLTASIQCTRTPPVAGKIPTLNDLDGVPTVRFQNKISRRFHSIVQYFPDLYSTHFSMVICVLVTTVNPAESTEPIEVPF